MPEADRWLQRFRDLDGRGRSLQACGGFRGSVRLVLQSAIMRKSFEITSCCGVLLAWTLSAQGPARHRHRVGRHGRRHAEDRAVLSAPASTSRSARRHNPSSPWPKFINKSYTRSIDFEAPASRVDRVRMQGENPPRGGGQQPVIGEQPQNQTIIVNAEHAVGAAARNLDDAARLPARRGRHNATVERRPSAARDTTCDASLARTRPRSTATSTTQNLVERVETWIDNAFFGDMLFEAIYTDYKDFGGVQFPTHIVQRQGGIRSST